MRAQPRLRVAADLLAKPASMRAMTRRLRVVSKSTGRNSISLTVPSELPGDDHRPALPQAVRVRQERDQLVALGEQVRRLPELVDREPEDQPAPARMTPPTRSWSQVMNAERFMLQSAEEVADVLVVGRRHLLRRAEEHDASLVQERDLCRHAEHRPNVVRDDDARHARARAAAS